MRDDAVERADNLSAQPAASVCRENTCKSELAAAKGFLLKICAGSDNLWSSVNYLVLEVR